MPGDDHGARALDVVVEREQAPPVAVEDRERVAAREVLPLHERAREHRRDRLDQLVEQREVGARPAAAAARTPR